MTTGLNKFELTEYERLALEADRRGGWVPPVPHWKGELEEGLFEINEPKIFSGRVLAVLTSGGDSQGKIEISFFNVFFSFMQSKRDIIW